MFLGYGSGVKGYKLWNPKTKRAFMSKSVVFNESVMYFDKLSSDVLPDFSEEQVSVEVEHSVEKENVTVDNDGATTSDDSDPDSAGSDDSNVQNSPPVLQPQQSIAACRNRRNCGPKPRLIEECNIVDYALSCAEQVDHGHEPSTYTEIVG